MRVRRAVRRRTPIRLAAPLFWDARLLRLPCRHGCRRASWPPAGTSADLGDVLYLKNRKGGGSTPPLATSPTSVSAGRLSLPGHHRAPPLPVTARRLP